MAAYDIGDALSRIENILLASIARNLRRHANEEKDYQKSWNMWQTEQLATLEKWSRRNLKAHADTFRQINDEAIRILQETNSSGEYDEEIQLVLSGLQRDADFFDLPDEKFSSLLSSVRQDLSKAEYSILRQADDIYRQSIWNAQVYLQSGSGTLNQAIDMTVKDMASGGIRSVIYRNGRRVPASSYARMALRTANERAQLMGEGRARDKYGVHTIIVPKSGICCPECAKWLCKVVVDDVYSGGTAEEADRLRLPLLSEAIAQGFMHPQCNCSPQTYFEGMQVPEITEAEREKAVDNYNLTQKQRYNEAQIRKYKRLQKNVADPAKQKEYAARVKDWQKRNQQLCDAHPDILRRDYNREKVWDEEVTPKQTVKEIQVITPEKKPEIKQEAPAQNTLEAKPNAESSAEPKMLDNSGGSGIIKTEDAPIVVKAHNLSSAFEKNDADNIVRLLNEAPNEVKKAYNQCEEYIEIDPHCTSRQSHYSWDSGVHIDITKMDTDMYEDVGRGRELFKNAYNELFHEIGHAIDNISGRNVNGGFWSSKISSQFVSQTYQITLGESLENEVNNSIAIYGKQELKKNLKDMPLIASADISDIFGAFTKNEVAAYTGHNVEYYASDLYAKAASEAFAEMFSAEINNTESLNNFKKYLPKSYDIFKEILAFISQINVRR